MTSTELGIFTFQGEASASVALAELGKWQRDGIANIQNAAVLARDGEGEIAVKEAADPDAGKGALIGAASVALAGLLAGPAGLVMGAAAGANAGNYAAHRIDLGIPNEKLEDIAKAVQPGTSAIIALIGHDSADQVVTRVEQYGTTAVRRSLQDEIAA